MADAVLTWLLAERDVTFMVEAAVVLLRGSIFGPLLYYLLLREEAVAARCCCYRIRRGAYWLYPTSSLQESLSLHLYQHYRKTPSRTAEVVGRIPT